MTNQTFQLKSGGLGGLEERIENKVEFYSENIGVINQRAGSNKAIYNFLSGGDLWTAKLHANHLFNTPAELSEYLANHFKINGITDKNQLGIIIKNGFATGFFSEEVMILFHLNVRKDKELQFIKSLPFLHSLSLTERQQAKATKTANQEFAEIIIPTI